MSAERSLQRCVFVVWPSQLRCDHNIHTINYLAVAFVCNQKWRPPFSPASVVWRLGALTLVTMQPLVKLLPLVPAQKAARDLINNGTEDGLKHFLLRKVKCLRSS